MRTSSNRRRIWRARQRGEGLVGALIAIPTLIFMGFGIIQTGLVYYGKSQIEYAGYEAARAGTVQHADVEAIRKAFARALIGYYGGGSNATELAESYVKAMDDLTVDTMRVEIVSPTRESFDDYASPALKDELGAPTRAIPNSGVSHLKCPEDNPSCDSDPKSNRSGQTLADANLLKLRITYGIPNEKQMPLVGRFYTWALTMMNKSDPDTFRLGLAKNGRIPVVVHTTMRMQSEAIENTAMISSPGAGSPHPSDPGTTPRPDPLPTCSVFDPACTGGGDVGGGVGGGDPPGGSCMPGECCKPI